MAHPVVSVKNRFQLSECAIKKAIPNKLRPISIYQKSNGKYKWRKTTF